MGADPPVEGDRAREGEREDDAREPAAFDPSTREEIARTEDEKRKQGETEAAVRGVAVIGLFTLGSRITGLAREATRAYFLGAGAAADAFQVAFQIPSILRRLVGEGATSSAVVPVAADFAARHGPDEQRIFAEKLFTLWTLIVLAVTLAGVAFAGAVVVLCFRWGSFGENPEKLALTASLARWLFGYLFLVGVAAVLQGLLNAKSRYAASSAAPLLFNLGLIAVAWIVAPRLDPDDRVWALAAGVLIGGLLQLGALLPSIWSLGIRPVPRWPFDHGAVRRVVKLFLPAVFGAGVYQVNVLASTILAASVDEEGAVSVLSYSNRLMEVVLGVFVFAIGTVSLTSLSSRAAHGDDEGFRKLVGDVVGWVTFITIPSAVGLWILRRPILAVLLRGGEFDLDALEMTAEAFRWHVLGLCFVGWSRILVNAFYARKDVATPLRIAAINLVAHIGLAIWLSSGALSYRGIALASTLSAGLQTALLWKALSLRGHTTERAPFMASLSRAGIATAIMGACVWTASAWLDPSSSKLSLALGLAIVIPLGALVYIAASFLLGQPQARMVLERLRRRKRG